jgi:uncharacterized OB-fold protein
MDIPRHWRLREQRYRLTGEVCEHCQARLFPPRDVCPECGAPAKTPFVFSGRGEVFSYSTVHQAPASHEEQAPYTVALIKLKEGPLVTAQLTDVDRSQLRIGLPVEMTTRVLQSNGDRGLIVYGYKFRPLSCAA